MLAASADDITDPPCPPAIVPRTFFFSFGDLPSMLTASADDITDPPCPPAIVPRTFFFSLNFWKSEIEPSEIKQILLYYKGMFALMKKYYSILYM